MADVGKGAPVLENVTLFADAVHRRDRMAAISSLRQFLLEHRPSLVSRSGDIYDPVEAFQAEADAQPRIVIGAFEFQTPSGVDSAAAQAIAGQCVAKIGEQLDAQMRKSDQLIAEAFLRFTFNLLRNM
jgi:hypothetical protein